MWTVDGRGRLRSARAFSATPAVGARFARGMPATVARYDSRMAEGPGPNFTTDRPNYAEPPAVDARRSAWPRPEAERRRSTRQIQRLRMRILLGVVAVLLVAFFVTIALWRTGPPKPPGDPLGAAITATTG